MDVLQTALEKALSGVSGTVLANGIARKLREKGILLSQDQKDQLKAHLSRPVDVDLNPLLESWSFPGHDADVVITITDTDIQDMKKVVDDLIRGMPELIQSMSDELASSVLDSLKRNWPRQARNERQLTSGFLRRLEHRWGVAFELLAMFLTIATDLGENISKGVRKEKTSRPHLLEVLTRLHARSCQVTSEIITLLRNGFADGAMARWRTLHEIAAVAGFIAMHGEKLAERYLLHEAVESRYAARQYQKHADRLGFEPYSQGELEALDRACEHLVRRFGSEFKGDYGWAWEQFHPRRPTISLIEEAAGIDHLRPFYRMAGHNVHANPKGVLFRLGLMDSSSVILTGASNFGLADPAQNAALSLMQVTSSLATLHTTLDTIVTTKAMLQLSHQIADTFVAIQKAMENETGSKQEGHDDQS